MEGVGERYASDVDGSAYEVPQDMSYEEWKNNLVTASSLQSPQKDGTIISQAGTAQAPQKSTVKQQHISQVVQALPNATDGYKTAIENHFTGGTSAAKDAFVKYVAPGSVADGAYAGTPHFDSSTQTIKMNFARDANDPRGVATAFFHEHGHFIDFVSCPGGGYTSLQSSAFGNALRTDFDTYVKTTMKANGLTRKTDAYAVISGELMDPIHNAISDLCGGLSQNKARGNYGHKTGYWSSKGALEKEAFAHLYVTQFDAERYALMQQYFPTALVEFEKLLRGMI